MNPIKYLNGLGLVASSARNIRDGAAYNKYFTPPSRQDKYLSYAGTTHDTIEFMSDIIKTTLADTKSIARVLQGSDLSGTLSNIFNFIFSHIQYKPDDPVNEELRRPARTWADRTTGVDCDCYSIFIGSILSNLNIPFALRMVKINGRNFYQHVYVVVPKDGRQQSLESRSSYFTVDPVLDTYNEEHPFTQKQDLFMQPIKYLNGVSTSATLNGLQGGGTNLYYSHEAAYEPRQDVIFFDGLDFYDRVEGFHGLGGLNGLGFLKKIWGAVKTVGKTVKKIAKAGIKKITTKSDGTNRALFASKEERAANKETRQAKRAERKEARKLKKVDKEAKVLKPVSSTAIGKSTASTGVTATDMIDIAKSMDKSMGVDSILNLVQAFAPDNKIINELVDAKSKLNAGVSSQEARQLASDATKAELYELQRMQLMQQQQQPQQPVQQAGMFGNIPNWMLLLAGAGATYMFMRSQIPQVDQK